MQAKELETKDAGAYAWFAAQDARTKSYAASTHYTAQQRLVAERAKNTLQMFYNSRVVLNYRKTQVSIKVFSTSPANPRAIRDLEQDWEARGWLKKTNPRRETIYTIPKNLL